MPQTLIYTPKPINPKPQTNPTNENWEIHRNPRKIPRISSPKSPLIIIVIRSARRSPARDHSSRAEAIPIRNPPRCNPRFPPQAEARRGRIRTSVQDERKRGELDWKRRHEVIVGVARGLLYLHEDSPCRIIHRDIKASNILLDQKWVPKIGDFGMARLFPEDQPQVNTRVAGTNGYMAPEYAMHGLLSVKADVFSFGVLVLELISGKRNATFKSEADAQNLLQWAWKLHKKGRALEIIDPILVPKEATDQILMCIQIGLLCTQGDPKLRPIMRRVVVMLSKKPVSLEEPARPGYPGARYMRSHRHSSGKQQHSASVSTSNLDTTITCTLTESPGPPSHQRHPSES
eukprot:TRINITY_DN935_c1_g1_i1.p1 TRINITY_DN935_c1_g1~~TRINITY_DN935_c1_g1_i1.p1  ORF type:complete len:346 (-),score=47.93 TRINITY_DN935_c1_g1_i1:200-1237(-)